MDGDPLVCPSCGGVCEHTSQRPLDFLDELFQLERHSPPLIGWVPDGASHQHPEKGHA
jgi:hypothetical protein